MIKQYVFLFHGMGKQVKGEWHKPFIESFHSALQHYSPYKGLSKKKIEEEHFKFIPINYDSVFEGYRKRWKKNANGVRDRVAAENKEIGRVFEWLGTSIEDDDKVETIFWDSLLDPLIWYGLPEARQAVVAKVNTQIGAALKTMYAEERTNTAHILAHSLGTSVMHDSLISLRHFPDHEGLFDPASHKWRTIGMIANVSRLLESKFKLDANIPRNAYKAYNSILNPGSADSICANYVNVRHRADPFTMPRRFNPGDWPTNAYSDIETVRFNDIKLVHSFTHYMENPRVHLPLIRLISGRVVLGTGPEIKKVWNEYIEKYPQSASIEFDSFRNLFSNDPDKKLDIKKLAKFLYEVYKELKE